MPKKSTTKVKSKTISSKKSNVKRVVAASTSKKKVSRSSKMLGVIVLLFVVVVLAFILSYLILPSAQGPEEELTFIQLNQTQEVTREEVEENKVIIESLRSSQERESSSDKDLIINSLR